MIEACLEDAKKAGMNGVAVMVRGGPGSPLKSWRDAQNAPTPYAVFSLIYNGELVADQQISGTRFRNIMNKLTG